MLKIFKIGFILIILILFALPFCPVYAHGGKVGGHTEQAVSNEESSMNHGSTMNHGGSTISHGSTLPHQNLAIPLYFLAAFLCVIIVWSTVKRDYRKVPLSYLSLFVVLTVFMGWGLFIQTPTSINITQMPTKTYGPGNNGDGPLHMIGYSAGLKQETLPKTDDIAKDPNDLPGPITRKTEEVVPITLITKEVLADVNEDSQYYYWTFNGTVPGPFIRVREGDTIELTITNDPKSIHAHSVDFHAVTGPGGGAVVTQVEAGESKKVRFKALNPGLFTYHCATTDVPSHMANGMYGQILVEPKEGLPPVDKEFYLMQGELFTDQEMGYKGFLGFDPQKLLDEKPTFILFNGKPGGSSKKMTVNVGEKVRIFFGNGSVAVPSAFHVIGEILDHVWPEGGWSKNPITNSQSILVGAGSSAIVDFVVEVPGTYPVVDHALSRLYRGGFTAITATGTAVPKVYNY